MAKLNPRKIAKSYMEQKEEELEKLGMIAYEPANGTLNINEELLPIPYDLTEIPSRDLGELMNALTQTKMFYRTLLGRQESCVEESRIKYYDASSTLYADMSKTKMSETAKERLINDAEEVRPFYLDYRDQKHKLNLVAYRIQNIEDALFLVSREVTRRNSDFETENRNHNVGKR